MLSDVHGELRALERALDLSDRAGVETIALLGDLFDFVEEADACARLLDGWSVVGVYGNHEAEVAQAVAAGELELEPVTIDLLTRLQDQVIIDEVRLIHDVPAWEQPDPVQALFGRGSQNGHKTAAWVTLSGHTHVRLARTEHGPVDISRGRLQLKQHRRYLVNPGALAVGQFAMWDRESHEIRFHQLDDWDATRTRSRR